MSVDAAKPLLPSGSAIRLYRKIQHQALKVDKAVASAKKVPLGYAFAHYETYASWMGCAVRHIYRLIAELLRFEWLEKQVRAGVAAFLRPLVRLVPSPRSHRPRPPGEWTKPLREIPVPDGQTTPTQHPVRPAVPAPASETVSPNAMSGVLSGVTAGVPLTKKDKLGTQQQAFAVKERENRPPVDLLGPEVAPVVAMMRKCQIEETSIARYVATLGADVMRRSCAYVLRRLEKGLSGGAGYAVQFARKLKAGEWYFDAWYLKEIEEQERKAASAPRPKPLAPIPPDWLPGVDEAEAREMVRLSVQYWRVHFGRQRFDYYGDPVRDKAREYWQRRHRDEPVPWAREGTKTDGTS